MREFECRVVGVTYSASDGSSRQGNIKELFDKLVSDPNDYQPVELIRYSYNGAPAYHVVVAGREIGNVPAESVAEVGTMLAAPCRITAELTASGRNAAWTRERNMPPEDDAIYSATLRIISDAEAAAPDPIDYSAMGQAPKSARPGKGLRIARNIFAVLAALDLIGVISMQDASTVYTIFVWAIPAVLFHFLAKRKEKGK